MANTTEIETAISKLKIQTIRLSLEIFETKENLQQLDRKKLETMYVEAAVKVGIQEFFERLDDFWLQRTSNAIGLALDFAQEKEDKLWNLIELVQQNGIENFIQQIQDIELLQHFCKILGLHPGTKEEMLQRLDDEIMLVGMDQFFKNIGKTCLQLHCEDIGEKTTGSEFELTERLMVCYFELEPLDLDSKKLQNQQYKTIKNKKKEDTIIYKGYKKGKGEKGRDKWECPGIETIVPGRYEQQDLHDNFNLSDLQEFCKQHDMSITGPKKAAIKRILHFLEHGEAPWEPPLKGKKRKKRGPKGPPKKKQATDINVPLQIENQDNFKPPVEQKVEEPTLGLELLSENKENVQNQENIQIQENIQMQDIEMQETPNLPINSYPAPQENEIQTPLENDVQTNTFELKREENNNNNTNDSNNNNIENSEPQEPLNTQPEQIYNQIEQQKENTITNPEQVKQETVVPPIIEQNGHTEVEEKEIIQQQQDIKTENITTENNNVIQTVSEPIIANQVLENTEPVKEDQNSSTL